MMIRQQLYQLQKQLQQNMYCQFMKRKITSTILGASQQQPCRTTTITNNNMIQNNCCARHSIIFNNIRYLSSNSTSNYHAFDMKMKVIQRDNAARSYLKYSDQNYNYFHQEIAYRLIDRLDDIQRPGGFPLALDINSGPGYIYNSICADDSIHSSTTDNNESQQQVVVVGGTGGMGGVKKLVQMDYSNEMLNRDSTIPIDGSHRCDTYRFHVDDHNDNDTKLPFPDQSFDLVISNCSLHYMNDLPTVLKEIHRILKPDGCFLWSMIGNVESTLYELSTSFTMAELERDSGISTHIGPYIPIQTVGTLLQQSKFTLPTIDVDTINLSYPNAFVLLEHLQRMGENNAFIHRKKNNISKDTFLAMACIYDHLFSLNHDEVAATIQVIYAIGWKEHESQPQPLQRGTAKTRIKDVIITKNTNDNE